MNEKILNNKRNGLAVMLLLIVVSVLAIAALVFGGIAMDSGKVASSLRCLYLEN